MGKAVRSGSHMQAHRAEKIVSNTALYTGAVLVQKTLSFFYFLFLSARFGPQELGGYLWVLSLSGLFLIGIDLGLTPIVTREAAKSGDVKRFVGAAFALKIPLAILTAVAFIVTVAIIRPERATLIMAMAATGIMVLDGFTMVLFAGLRALQTLRYEAITLILFQITVFVSGVVLTLATHDLTVVILALLLGSALNFVLMSWAARKVIGSWIRPLFDRETVVRGLLKFVPAFGLSTIFTRVYAVADTIILGVIAGDRAVGLYAIPAKIATAFQSLIPGAFTSAIYPAMANYARHAPEKLAELFERTLIYLLLLALPIAAGLVIIAGPLIGRLWPEYVGAVPAFRAFMVGVPFIFLSFPTGSLLNAVGREKSVAANRGVATAANVILNIVLIPPFGVLGAAIAYALSNVMLFLLDFFMSLRAVAIRPQFLIKTTLLLVLSTCIMSGVALLLGRLHFLLIVAAAFVLYAACVVAFGIIGKDELRMLKTLLRRKSYEANPSLND